jgi:hypothetical protein
VKARHDVRNPIVDLRASREAALTAFAQLRGSGNSLG